MANRSILGVSLEACLKVKLLQSIIKTNPFTCSSGSSIMASNESNMARKISTNVYLSTWRKAIWVKLINNVQMVEEKGIILLYFPQVHLIKNFKWVLPYQGTRSNVNVAEM